MTNCSAPIPLDDLIAYQLGELPEARQAAVEEHYFGCAACTQRLGTIAQLGDAVADAVRRGLVSASVTSELVDRAIERGLEVRTYRLQPGEQVACTAAPSDDVVVVRLGLAAAGSERIDVAGEITATETGQSEQLLVSDVSLDPSVGELVLMFPGEQIRQYPKIRVRMEAVVHDATGERRVGPYTLNHTPWEQLEEPR